MREPILVAPCDVGRGVFTSRLVHAGETLLTFRGRPYPRSHAIHSTPRGAYLLQVDSEKYIMPRAPARFVNHSCEPNSGLVDACVLVALVDLERGREVRFDYSTSMDEDLWTMPCACGQPSCRGVVRDFRFLPADLQRRYLEMGVVSPFIRAQYVLEKPEGDVAAA